MYRYIYTIHGWYGMVENHWLNMVKTCQLRHCTWKIQSSQENKCTKGDACTFAHGDDEMLGVAVLPKSTFLVTCFGGAVWWPLALGPKFQECGCWNMTFHPHQRTASLARGLVVRPSKIAIPHTMEKAWPPKEQEAKSPTWTWHYLGRAIQSSLTKTYMT